MKKLNSKTIVARIRSKQEKLKKENITFRLTKSVIDDFRRSCKRQDVMPGHVIEEMMKDFAQLYRGK